MNRIRTIDLCRGLLFIFMMNTHALTIAGVPSSHWLFSDFWLPNGWATLVFVVLSGYGVGFLFSTRTPVADRDAALRHRSRQILAVMLVSNMVFAGLREVAASNTNAIADLDWWVGFLTLDTDWTISGVLLPTALVLLCGPFMIRATQKHPWLTLIVLAIARYITSILVLELHHSAAADNWFVRLLLLEGLSGFPVLPFVLNGCLGIWLGVQRHQNLRVWRGTMAILMIIQVLIYLSTLRAPFADWQAFVISVRAGSKFAWIFAVSQLFVSHFFRQWTAPIDLLGRYALGSFVLHRGFLQTIEIAFTQFDISTLPAEVHFLILFFGTLLMTWLVCVLRERFAWIDRQFRRLAL